MTIHTCKNNAVCGAEHNIGEKSGPKTLYMLLI
jgi:hypothetical protein